MALHYQTEYGLGRRGRIRRSYTGYQAFVAIACDLVFGLLFELVFSIIGLALKIVALTIQLMVRLLQLYWRFLVAVMTVVVYAVTMPFVWVNLAMRRLRSRQGRGRDEGGWTSDPLQKPSWAYGREL